MTGASSATERRPSAAVSPPQPAAEPTPSPTKPPTNVAKPTRKPGKKAKPLMSERTPLIVKKDDEQQEAIHPLPWFRSPEMKRASPDARQLQRNDRRRKHRYRRGGRSRDDDSLCSRFVDAVCCGLVQSDNEPDLEYGETRSEMDSDGFKRCVQCLVALIVVVAVILILIIIFEPFHEAATMW
ncbi:hypothetical protein PINS_up021291 [Pythium insidiosum]|nr:hypothetical protein PINS_up012326 [Pythium insidiosum]GLE09563.1 hypothetical protein PINS_up021291 [Pythium insidiosum]